MHKSVIKYLIAITIILALVLSGCGKTISITDKEDVPEESASQNDDSNDKDEKVDKDDKDDDDDSDNGGSLLGGFFEKDDKDDLKEVKWDKSIPNIFPEPKDGKCVVCQTMEDEDEGVWVLYYVDLSEKDIEDYYEDLEDDGWEQISSMDMGEISSYTFTKDEYAISTTMGIDEDEGIIFGLFLEEDAEHIGMDSTSDMDDDEMDEEPDEKRVYEEQEVPKDYPENEVPLFEDGSLVAATRIVSDGEIMFMLDYMSEDPFDEVKEEVLKLYVDKTSSNQSVTDMGEMMMITGETENYGYSIILGKTDDEYYPANVSITVMGEDE